MKHASIRIPSKKTLLSLTLFFLIALIKNFPTPCLWSIQSLSSPLVDFPSYSACFLLLPPAPPSASCWYPAPFGLELILLTTPPLSKANNPPPTPWDQACTLPLLWKYRCLTLSNHRCSKVIRKIFSITRHHGHPPINRFLWPRPRTCLLMEFLVHILIRRASGGGSNNYWEGR